MARATPAEGAAAPATLFVQVNLDNHGAAAAAGAGAGRTVLATVFDQGEYSLPTHTVTFYHSPHPTTSPGCCGRASHPSTHG